MLPSKNIRKPDLLSKIKDPKSGLTVEDALIHEDFKLIMEKNKNILFHRILMNNCEWFTKIINYALFNMMPPPNFCDTLPKNCINHNSSIFLQDCNQELFSYLEENGGNSDLTSATDFRSFLIMVIKKFISENKNDPRLAAHFIRFISTFTIKSLKLSVDTLNLLIPFLVDNCKTLAYLELLRDFLWNQDFDLYTDIKYPLLSKMLYNACLSVKYISDSSIEDYHDYSAIKILKERNRKEKLNSLDKQVVNMRKKPIPLLSSIFKESSDSINIPVPDIDPKEIHFESQFITDNEIKFNDTEEAEMHAYLLIMTIRSMILNNTNSVDYFRDDIDTNYSLMEALFYCGSCCSSLSLISLEAFKILGIVFNGDLSLGIDRWKFLENEKNEIDCYNDYADLFVFEPNKLTYKMIHAFPVFWSHRYNIEEYKMSIDEQETIKVDDYYQSLAEQPTDLSKYNRKREKGENAYEILQPCIVCNPPISSFLLYNAMHVFIQMAKYRKELHKAPNQTEIIRDKMIAIDGLLYDFFCHTFNFANYEKVTILDIYANIFSLNPDSDFYQNTENQTFPSLNEFLLDFSGIISNSVFFENNGKTYFSHFSYTRIIYEYNKYYSKYILSYQSLIDTVFDISLAKHSNYVKSTQVDEFSVLKKKKKKKISHLNKKNENKYNEPKETDQDDTIKADKDNVFYGYDTEQYHKTIEKVGEGYTTVAYKIIDTRTEQIMCKKILKINKDKTTIKNLQNAMKEFEVLHALNHPSICRAIGINTAEQVDSDEDSDVTTVALFLEFIDYKLTDCLKFNIKNTLKTRVVVEIVHGMIYLHKNKIIHRNLKIDNILLNCVFEAKIINFALIRINECLDDLYLSTSISMDKDSSNMIFMSPEMLNDEEYDYPTDVYSFGIILYYIFVGSLPKQSLKDKLNGNEIPLPEASPSISQFCIDLISKCIRYNPTERPTFDDILKDLRDHSYKLASEIDQSIVSRRDIELNDYSFSI